MMTRILIGLISLLCFQQVFGAFDATTCGITKGCRIPTECKGGKCNDMGVSWRLIDDSNMELELFVKAEKANGVYVAVGFSDDDTMGNEPVIECSAVGKEPASFKFSYDKPNTKGNSRIDGDFSSHFINPEISHENGVLYCKSTVKVSGSPDNVNVFKFDPDQQYHLLLVNGKTTPKGVSYHGGQSAVSPKIRLTNVQTGFDESECGKTKGCTRPADDACYGTYQGMGASYKMIDDTHIEFEIFGPVTANDTNVYVALGFSDHQNMDNISVLECSKLVGEQTPSMKFSYNPGFNNSRIEGEKLLRGTMIKQSAAQIADNKVYCKGVVDVGGSTTDPKVFKWNKDMGYYLMLAAGPTDQNGLTHHHGDCHSFLTFLDQVSNIGFDDDACGVTVGCFAPQNCTDVDCNMKTSWKVVSDDTIQIELSAKLDGLNQYVAMGFSPTGSMSPTSVIECSSINSQPYSMTYSANIITEAKRYNNIRSAGDVSGLFTKQQVEFKDGQLYCTAQVKVSGDANDAAVFKYEPAKNYSVILASGSTKYNETTKLGGIGYHHTRREVNAPALLTDIAPTTVAPPVPTGDGTFDAKTCGTNKGCFLSNANGDFEVSYRVINDDSIEFEISGAHSSSNGVYTALAFSSDGAMGPASVIECSALQGQPLSMKFSYNEARNNVRIGGEEAIRATYITNAQSSYVNGKAYCKGTVRVNGASNGQIFKYNKDQQYVLLIAKGAASASGLNYHGSSGQNTFKSTARLLSDVGATGSGSNSTVLILLHAIFMTIAWMVMVPTAVIFARVLRSSWPTVKPGGLLIWFHIHRTANLLGIALMIAAFVCILVYKKWKFEIPDVGWGGAHGIIGVIALCLAWLQPFISTLRCSPNDPRRPIFNYVHRIIGVVAMIMATTAICIAGYHFTETRNVVQLILGLIPISIIFALSLFFLIFNKSVDVDTKSFVKVNGHHNGNGNSQRVEDIPMRPTSKNETTTTWTIQSQDSKTSPNDQTVHSEEPKKPKLWVNRFREIVVYMAVAAFVAVGVTLSVFFGLAFN